MNEGQAGQDEFVLNILKQKRNGFFLEIGSHHPISINNTYLLEKEYDWKGIMIEYQKKWLQAYKTHRPNSVHIIDNATMINYKNLFNDNEVPTNVDYLQIDLEVSNDSTMKTLERLNKEVFDKYKFATITFEHDRYLTDHGNTRERSRQIFESRGYVCVFKDINNIRKNPNNFSFEDWYVHPDLVDMEYIEQLIQKNSKNYKSSPVEKSIYWGDIEY